MSTSTSRSTAAAGPSLSASLVLLAPLSKKTPDGFDYRVLLLQRHGRASAFKSAHVFPGGNMDPVDRRLDRWRGMFKNEEQDDAQLSLKLCALRETFEECGILLADNADKWHQVAEPERQQWRDKVHQNGPAFLELWEKLGSGARPSVSSLTYRANWITPRMIKRRFDTHFYIAILPPQSTGGERAASVVSEPIVSSDGKETISADWMTPKQAIDRTCLHSDAYIAGKAPPKEAIILFPPQFYLIAELTRFKSWRDLVSDKDKDARGLPKVRSRTVRPYEPEIVAVEDDQGKERGATVLVGDPLHSLTEEVFGKAVDANCRHRTYVLTPTGTTEEERKAKTPPMMTVQGVQRRGLASVLDQEWDDMDVGNTGSKTSKM